MIEKAFNGAYCNGSLPYPSNACDPQTRFGDGIVPSDPKVNSSQDFVTRSGMAVLLSLILVKTVFCDSLPQ
jgi:hypothetical protein